MRAFPLGEPGPVDLERGEVSAGGVRLEAVASRTMAVKGWDNLRVCGELLDIDGPVGGFNLQAAFSTGFVAGSSVVRVRPRCEDRGLHRGEGRAHIPELALGEPGFAAKVGAEPPAHAQGDLDGPGALARGPVGGRAPSPAGRSWRQVKVAHA